MKNLLIGLAATIVVLVAVVSVAAQTPEEQIRAADEGWAQVFGAKDLKASLDFCADDASFMAPNAPTATGKKAIGEAFAGLMALPDLKIIWHASKIEVARSGELAYSSGVYVMSFNDPTGKVVKDHGKYLTLWKKQKNGSWKVIYDIFNTDLAASGQ